MMRPFVVVVTRGRVYPCGYMRSGEGWKVHHQHRVIESVLRYLNGDKTPDNSLILVVVTRVLMSVIRSVEVDSGLAVTIWY
jgi:hypothetical protein